ncbi:YfhO family protein [Sporolactobacillus pectinivorans]|uniref:YfhO family protein n=1 Tax=Sporolactobacillus pectinivorans TaxID=1591408 RepID=UPI000C260166|nr:YfhO family protein [Sporolactobacillus pectinivorans]
MIRNRSKLLVAVLSFILPILLLNIIFFSTKIYPFGKYSLLQADLKYQYISFLAYLRTSILSGHFNNLVYSFSASVGSSMSGLVAYYYLNPLFVVLLFFKTDSLPTALYIISNLIVGLAGLSMFYYCTHSKLTKVRLSFILIFSCSFALMSYNLTNLSNVMWLTDIIILPFVALGIEKLITENKGKTYFFSLALSILFNYYIGYMLCIFSIIYFIYIWLLKHDIDLKNIRESASIFRKYIILSVFSVLVNLFLLLPTIIATAAAKSSSTHQSFSFHSLINPFLVVRSLLVVKNTEFAVPNIYCGLLITVLVVLYFINHKIPRKEKLISLFLLLFIYACFQFQLLNIAWQMFRTPQGFPQRFSFIMSFLLIILAMKSVQDLSHMNRADFIKAFAWISLVMFFTILSLHYGYIRTSLKQIILSLFVIAIYSGFLLFLSKNPVRFRLLTISLLIFIASGELITTGLVSFAENGQHDDYQSFKNYVDQNQPVIRRIQNQDQSFFRIEKNYERFGPALDDSLLFNYYGISHYSSSLNIQTRNALGNLGFTSFNSVWPSWIDYNQGSTIADDTLLGVKYVISDSDMLNTGNLNHYQKTYSYSGKYIFRNPYFVGTGMLSNSDFTKMHSTDNPFDYQNEFWTLLGNSRKQLFNPIRYAKTYHNVRLIKGTLSKVDNLKDGYLTLTFHQQNGNPVYFELSNYRNCIQQNISYQVFLGNRFIASYPTYLNNGIIPLDMKGVKGLVKLRLEIPANASIANPDIRLYEQNMADFKSIIGKLKENEFTVSKINSTYLEGKITASARNQYLFLSIPYDKNWHATVNNRPVQINKAVGNFILIPLTNGVNKIVMHYSNIYLLCGVIVSLIAVLALIAGFVMTQFKGHRGNL